MDSGRWVSSSGCPQGFCRTNKHCNRRTTANCGAVYSGTSPNAELENKTVVVPDRRRGSHDQSEDAAFYGRSYAGEGSFASCGQQPDVHGAKSCDQHNPGSGAGDPVVLS